MVRLSGILKKTCWGFVIAASLTACIDKSKYQETVTPGSPESGVKVPNSFDFSTVQKVNLSVDYSAYKTYGPVFFGVYAENPFITVEGAPDDQWNEDVKPIFEDYTRRAMVSSMQWWNYLPMPSICILPQETSSLV